MHDLHLLRWKSSKGFTCVSTCLHDTREHFVYWGCLNSLNMSQALQRGLFSLMFSEQWLNIFSIQMSKMELPALIMLYVCNLSHIILVQAKSHSVVKRFIGTWVWKSSNYRKLGPVTTLSVIFVKFKLKEHCALLLYGSHSSGYVHLVKIKEI